MEKDGILDTVSIDRVSVGQNEDEGETSPHPSQLNDEIPVLNNDNLPTAYIPKAAKQDEDEFVVNKIVRHIVENGQVLYPLPWYGVLADGDTAEPAKNIPSHFI